MKKFVRFLISLVMLPFFIFIMIPVVCIIEYVEEDDGEKEISKQMKKEMLMLGWGWLTFQTFKEDKNKNLLEAAKHMSEHELREAIAECDEALKYWDNNETGADHVEMYRRVYMKALKEKS